EAAVSQLATGLPVSFTVAATNKPFKGRVASISPTADSSSRTFRVRVTPDPGQDGLRAGMFANLSVAVQSLEGALLVPQEAIVEFTNKNIERFVELADAAEVLAFVFRLFPQRLIIDFRYDEIDAPMIKVAQRVNSAQERLRELAKSRPRFATPERFFFILWPR